MKNILSERNLSGAQAKAILTQENPEMGEAFLGIFTWAPAHKDKDAFTAAIKERLSKKGRYSAIIEVPGMRDGNFVVIAVAIDNNTSLLRPPMVEYYQINSGPSIENLKHIDQAIADALGIYEKKLSAPKKIALKTGESDPQRPESELYALSILAGPMAKRDQLGTLPPKGKEGKKEEGITTQAVYDAAQKFARERIIPHARDVENIMTRQQAESRRMAIITGEAPFEPQEIDYIISRQNVDTLSPLKAGIPFDVALASAESKRGNKRWIAGQVLVGEKADRSAGVIIDRQTKPTTAYYFDFTGSRIPDATRRALHGAFADIVISEPLAGHQSMNLWSASVQMIYLIQKATAASTTEGERYVYLGQGKDKEIPTMNAARVFLKALDKGNFNQRQLGDYLRELYRYPEAMKDFNEHWNVGASESLGSASSVEEPSQMQENHRGNETPPAANGRKPVNSDTISRKESEEMEAFLKQIQDESIANAAAVNRTPAPVPSRQLTAGEAWAETILKDRGVAEALEKDIRRRAIDAQLEGFHAKEDFDQEFTPEEIEQFVQLQEEKEQFPYSNAVYERIQNVLARDADSEAAQEFFEGNGDEDPFHLWEYEANRFQNLQMAGYLPGDADNTKNPVYCPREFASANEHAQFAALRILYESQEFQQAHRVLIPFNLSNAHWVAIIINKAPGQKPRFTVMDPQGDDKSGEGRIRDVALMVMSALKPHEDITLDTLDRHCTIDSLPAGTRFQEDGINCGVLTAMLLRRYNAYANAERTANPDQAHANVKARLCADAQNFGFRETLRERLAQTYEHKIYMRGEPERQYNRQAKMAIKDAITRVLEERDDDDVLLSLFRNALAAETAGDQKEAIQRRPYTELVTQFFNDNDFTKAQEALLNTLLSKVGDIVNNAKPEWIRLIKENNYNNNEKNIENVTGNIEQALHEWKRAATAPHSAGAVSPKQPVAAPDPQKSEETEPVAAVYGNKPAAATPAPARPVTPPPATREKPAAFSAGMPPRHWGRVATAKAAPKPAAAPTPPALQWTRELANDIYALCARAQAQELISSPQEIPDLLQKISAKFKEIEPLYRQSRIDTGTQEGVNHFCYCVTAILMLEKGLYGMLNVAFLAETHQQNAEGFQEIRRWMTENLRPVIVRQEALAKEPQTPQNIKPFRDGITASHTLFNMVQPTPDDLQKKVTEQYRGTPGNIPAQQQLQQVNEAFELVGLPQAVAQRGQGR